MGNKAKFGMFKENICARLRLACFYFANLRTRWCFGSLNF